MIRKEELECTVIMGKIEGKKAKTNADGDNSQRTGNEYQRIDLDLKQECVCHGNQSLNWA